MSAPADSPLTNPHARPHTRDGLNHLFTDRYPTLADLLHFGGVPGVRYGLVSVQRVAHYQSLGWDLVSRLPVLTIEITTGAHAGAHSAMLMCNGRPIPGAALDGSTRAYGIDPMLDEATGLGPAKPASAKPPKVPTGAQEAR